MYIYMYIGKYIFKHLKCIFKLKKVENIAGQTARPKWLNISEGTHGYLHRLKKLNCFKKFVNNFS